MLIPTNESKEKNMKNSLWWKIYENQIYSDDKLPLNKTIEISSTIIVVRTTFHENNKYYPHIIFTYKIT